MLKTLFEITKNTRLSAPKPLSETPIDTIDHFTSIMGSLFGRAGFVTEEVVLGSGLVDGGRCSQGYCSRCIELRCINVFYYPNSWAYFRNIYSHRQSYNHRTQTTIKHTESVGSTKEPTNFLLYTARCCSASNLTFHAFSCYDVKSSLPKLHSCAFFLARTTIPVGRIRPDVQKLGMVFPTHLMWYVEFGI